MAAAAGPSSPSPYIDPAAGVGGSHGSGMSAQVVIGQEDERVTNIRESLRAASTTTQAAARAFVSGAAASVNSSVIIEGLDQKGSAFYQELSALLSQKGRIYLIEHPHKFKRLALLAGAILVSGMAKGPYVSISLRAHPLGPLVAVCEMLVWFAAEFKWSLEIIDDLLEKQPFKEGASLRTNILTAIFAVVLAACGQLPVGIPSARYNKSWATEAFIGVAIANLSLNVRNNQLMIQKGLRCCDASEEPAAHLQALQEEMLKLLRKNLQMFLNGDSGFRDKFADKLSDIGDIASGPTQANALWNLLENPIRETQGGELDSVVGEDTPLLLREEAPSESRWQTVSEGSATVLGSAMTAIFEFTVGYYTYYYSEQWSGSPPLAAAASGVSMFGFVLMMGKGATTTIKGIVNAGYNYITGNHQPKIVPQVAPDLSRALKGLSVVAGAFACATTWIIWHDFFNEKDVWPWEGKEIARWVTVINNTLTIGCTLLTTLIPMVDQSLELWLMQKEPEGRGKLIACARTLEQLIALVEAMPAHVLQEITERAGETEDTSFGAILARSRQLYGSIQQALEPYTQLQ